MDFFRQIFGEMAVVAAHGVKPTADLRTTVTQKSDAQIIGDVPPTISGPKDYAATPLNEKTPREQVTRGIEKDAFQGPEGFASTEAQCRRDLAALFAPISHSAQHDSHQDKLCLVPTEREREQMMAALHGGADSSQSAGAKKGPSYSGGPS